jgi:hypothetical protein
VPASRAARFHQDCAHGHRPLGASQRGVLRSGAPWGPPGGAAGDPARGSLLPRELGAGPGEDATGRSPELENFFCKFVNAVKAKVWNLGFLTIAVCP